MDEENLITPYLSLTDELNPFHTVGIRSSLLHQPLSFSGQTAVSNGCSNPSFDHLSCIYIYFILLAASIELYSSTNVITDPITGFKLSTLRQLW
jgi:hypothetical protein